MEIQIQQLGSCANMEFLDLFGFFNGFRKNRNN